MQKQLTKKEVKHIKLPQRKIPARIPEQIFNPFTATLEDKDEVIVRMDLPDVNEEDVTLGFADGNLIIEGKIKTQEYVETSKGAKIERHKKAFHKQIPMPQRVNPRQVKVKFDDGMLEIKLPLEKEEIEN